MYDDFDKNGDGAAVASFKLTTVICLKWPGKSSLHAQLSYRILYVRNMSRSLRNPIRSMRESRTFSILQSNWRAHNKEKERYFMSLCNVTSASPPPNIYQQNNLLLRVVWCLYCRWALSKSDFCTQTSGPMTPPSYSGDLGSHLSPRTSCFEWCFAVHPSKFRGNTLN